MRKILPAILFVLFASSFSLSDTFSFKNGDTVKGKVVKENPSEYTIKTELFGEITVKKDAVDKITADQPAALTPAIKVYPKPVKISVLDFQVQSDNPDYKYLGKGFTEFVSVELLKSKDMVIVDREHLKDVLTEQKLSMTGLMDEKNQIEIGKLISANYFLTGKIIDIMNRITITYKVTDITTGETILEQKIEENPSKYDYISAYITKDVLTNFSAAISPETNMKIAKAQDKPVEVAVKFSNAVDAYDKKNFEAAKKDLTEAKKLDPANDAVKAYILKLFKNTSKFKVMPERYASYQNPAFLGLLESDTLYSSSSGMNPVSDPTQLIATPGSELGASEKATKGSQSYFFPLTKGLGIGIEFLSYYATDTVTGPWGTMGPGGSYNPHYQTTGNNYVSDQGFMLTAGLKINNNFSLGAGAMTYRQIREYYLLGVDPEPPLAESGYNKREYSASAYEVGLLLKDDTSSVIFDAYYAFTNESFYLYDSVLNEFHRYTVPSVFEGTLTCALNNNQTFFVLKQYDYFYSDKDYFIASLMPAAEQWFFNTFSLRAGYEFSYFDLSGVKSSGNGYTLGFTLPVDFLAKWTVDINYTSRQRASRNLAGLKIDETILFFTVSLSDILFNQKR